MSDIDYTLKRTLENDNFITQTNIVVSEIHRILQFSPTLLSFDGLGDRLYEDFGVDSNEVARRLGYKDFEMFCRHNLAMKRVIESIDENKLITPIIQDFMKATVEQVRESHKEKQEEREKRLKPKWQIRMEEELDDFDSKGFYPTDDELDVRYKIVQALWEFMQRTQKSNCSHGEMNKFLQELFNMRLNAALHRAFTVRDKTNRTAKLPDLQTAMQFELQYQGATEAGTIFFKFNTIILNRNGEPDLQLIEHYYKTVRERREKYKARKAEEASRREPKQTSTVEWD